MLAPIVGMAGAPGAMQAGVFGAATPGFAVSAIALQAMSAI